jgi:tetratricopeptide (TPR) repeat protein
MTALALHGNPYAQPNVSGLGNFLHTFMAAFNPDQFALPLFAGLIMLALTLVFLVLVCINRTRLPLMLLVLIFAVAPTNSFLCHWFDNEQRGHLFGYWFGHDMFTPPFNAKDGKPLYPEMARHAILYGGTDPGRFAPTYMIFDESFTPAEKKIDPKFDRRDVYIITQNALADGTYLMYIRSHYNRSSQKAMGMDVPFFQELTRTKSDREEYKTNAISKLLSKPLDTFFTGVGETIEKDRRVGTSYFKPEVFTDLKKFTARLSAHSTAFDKQLFDGLSASTKSLLNGGNETQLRAALAADLNKLLDAGFYDDKEIVKLVEDRYPAVAEWEKAKARRRELTQGQSPEALAQVTPSLDSAVAIGQQRVSALTEKIQSAADAIAANLTANGVPLTPRLKKFIAEAPHQPRNFTKVRLMRQLVEAAFPQEIAVSLGGVYPDLEMYISTPEDSAQCFADYMADAGERARRGQLKPGENVSVEGGKLQVSGQVAVMSINGYISKNMFDQNPDNEFYVEESFPMDWMYDYITPFGVIMKVNRQPLAEISQEICDRDHEFWSQYSARFIGNWITYDTSVKDVCDWAEKTYLRHDFSGFKGDRAFVRDDSGQKAFSKLRSSIASSIYVHRAGKSKNNIEQARMIKEADFALKQAYAYCPYSPEAVYNYVSLLANTGRGTDALLIASTALKLDPYNDSFKGLVKNLEGYSSNQIPPLPAKDKLAETLGKMEADFKANPENFQNAFDLSAAYHQLGRTNDAFAVLKKISDSPKADAGVLLVVAQANAAMNDFPALEKTLARILVLAPDDPENHYNVAALKSVLGKKEEALAAFAKCAELNAPRLAKNPKARDLVTAAQTDDRFAPIRDTPEFKKLIGK